MTGEHAGEIDARTTVFFECDHLRPLVQDEDGEWRHITHDGGLGGVCGATSVYRMEATVIGQHDLSKYVRSVPSGGSLEGPEEAGRDRSIEGDT